MRDLFKGARDLGLSIQPSQEFQFRQYFQELTDWNRRMNLTSVVELQRVENVHFLDSLTVSLSLPKEIFSGGSLVDVGTGAGFPGVPLKILFPAMSVTLIEAVAKKTAFLEHLMRVLGISGIDVRTGRSEVFARDPALREKFDVVVSRAVGSLRVLAELTLPFCRLGGLVVLQKKGDIGKEIEDAMNAVSKVGGNMFDVKHISREILAGKRCLVVLKKTRPTPEKYPRRSGFPAKRPL